MYIVREKTKMQPQSTVGIASHGVIATTITTTEIDPSPTVIMVNMHIDSIKSTILMSLANLINIEITDNGQTVGSKLYVAIDFVTHLFNMRPAGLVL